MPFDSEKRKAQVWWRSVGVVFGLLVIVAGIVLLRPSVRGNDGVQNYVYLRSLMFDGDLDFSNEYCYYFEKDAGWFDRKMIPRDPVTDRPMNLYGMGNSVMWAPWVMGAHFAGNVAIATGMNVRMDGYGRLHETGVGIGSCVYASIGLLLLYALLRRYYNPDAVVWALLGIWLATPLMFYMYLHPSMSHANSFFLVTVLVWLYLTHDKVLHWAVMGALYGLLAMTRLQDAGFIVAIGVGELLLARARRDDHAFNWHLRFARYAVLCIAAFIVFIPQLLAWNYLQGSPFSGPRGYFASGSVRLYAPVHVWQVAFSSWHGLFFWHPLLLFAVAGLFRSETARRAKLIAITAFVAQWWIVSSWSIWWAGASFGHRMFVSTLPFLAFGMCSMVATQGKPRLAMRIIILLFIFWNFGYIVQYGTGMIPRNNYVSLGTLIRNNFVNVPAKLFRF